MSKAGVQFRVEGADYCSETDCREIEQFCGRVFFLNDTSRELVVFEPSLNKSIVIGFPAE